MYQQIASNRRRTFLLFSVFLVVIIGIGYFFSYIYQDSIILVGFVIFSVGMSWFSYFYSDRVVLAISGAKRVEKETAPQLYRIVENLAITAGLPLPKIYLIPDPAMNAFATGRDNNHSAVAVTSGLLQRLDKTELEGVIAHELSHIKNRDILLQTVVVTLVGLVALLSRWFLRFSFWGGGQRKEGGQLGLIMMIAGIALAILAPIAVKLIQLAISRKREYLADGSAALLTRYPKGLADALKKISQDDHQLRTANEATAHLFISSPIKRRRGRETDARQSSWLTNLFTTHPPVEKRIKALNKMIPKGDY
jgi:heat shock protein HtpX